MTTLRVFSVVFCFLLVPTAAHADGSRRTPAPVPVKDLADGTGAVAPSAAGGHVVFSRFVPATQRYELVEWTAIAGVRTLPVADRAIPFDADVGRDANGRLYVTFSRCAKDGVLAGVLPALDFTGAAGCRAQVLRLDRPGGRVRNLKLRGSARLSLTTPSLHGDTIAAVAAPTGSSTNARVLFWRTPSAAPVRLRGGVGPRCPYASCTVAPRSGVDALDLGAQHVVFIWRISQPDFGAGPGWWLRVSRVSSPQVGWDVPEARGYVSGACGFRQPLSPNASGIDGAQFLLAQSPCYQLQTTFAERQAESGVTTGVRPTGGVAYGVARDGADVYWLSGAVPSPEEDGEAAGLVPCARARGTCRLVVSAARDLREPDPDAAMRFGIRRFAASEGVSATASRVRVTCERWTKVGQTRPCAGSFRLSRRGRDADYTLTKTAGTFLNTSTSVMYRVAARASRTVVGLPVSTGVFSGFY